MNRRDFISHAGGFAALSSSSLLFQNSILANANKIKKENKSTILLWMSGGPSTIDIWDLKPDSASAGAFKPINTNVDGIQICEHLPLLSKMMDNLSIIRSMSTREADHGRGRYYMHTGYVPNPNIEHPSYGSVISHELLKNTISQIGIPPFISIGGTSIGPGFLGATYAPLVVDYNGTIRNIQSSIDRQILQNRLDFLAVIENKFIQEKRGEVADSHAKMLNKTVDLIFGPHTEVFKISKEPQNIRERYGNTSFGKGCLMARRLVEIGVPFIEVEFGGWDNHMDIFTALPDKLSQMDVGMSALIEDLMDRGLYESTNIIWMGEFGRTPDINKNAGRDHWARSWSAVVGGGKLNKGIVVGETSEDGKKVISEAYSSEDLMATVLKSLDISLETTFTSKNGRPMKIANSGKIIKELI
jgi:uncharacterized protein (DUF1501 family)